MTVDGLKQDVGGKMGIQSEAATERRFAGVSGVLSKIALLSMPRTGSTMVARQLAKHAKIKFVGSIFSEQGWLGIGKSYRELQKGLQPEWEDISYRIAHHRRLLAKWFDTGGAAQCVGLKHHLSGAPEVTETLISDAQVSTILLTRANLLACYSSDKLARAGKTASETANGHDAWKVSFDPGEFKTYVERRQRLYNRWQSKIVARPGPWLELEYIEARQRSGIERIINFIGLDPNDLEGAYTPKRNSDNVISRFENTDRVARYLEENGLQAWGSENDGLPPADQAQHDANAAAEQERERSRQLAPRRAERLRQHQAALETLRTRSAKNRV
jgi:hypothetical protein